MDITAPLSVVISVFSSEDNVIVTPDKLARTLYVFEFGVNINMFALHNGKQNLFGCR